MNDNEKRKDIIVAVLFALVAILVFVQGIVLGLAIID
jgi:hypothetical protein